MQFNKNITLLVLILALLGLSGCASQANKDPFESVNRGIYKFNTVTDKALIKPVAQAYSKVTPTPIRQGISNFFSNLGSLSTILNDLLQFKFSQAFTDTGRFLINSTVGIGGLIDVAGMDGIPRHTEDFGQTLGAWGIGQGAYLVMPFFGPSTARDGLGFAIDNMISPISMVHNQGEIQTSNQLRGAQIISVRSELLNAIDLIDEAALDPYAFTRDGYLQLRENLVNDGALTSTEDDEDLFSDEFTQ